MPVLALLHAEPHFALLKLMLTAPREALGPPGSWQLLWLFSRGRGMSERDIKDCYLSAQGWTVELVPPACCHSGQWVRAWATGLLCQCLSLDTSQTTNMASTSEGEKQQGQAWVMGLMTGEFLAGCWQQHWDWAVFAARLLWKELPSAECLIPVSHLPSK